MRVPYKTSDACYHRGFTLIELIVSIAIFAAMTALVIAKYGSFNQNTLITDMAYDVALTVRTAQTYGVSVKSVSGGDVFTSAYGVHFDLTNKTAFTFFADANSNGIYDDGSSNDITTYTLTKGATIGSICLGSDYDQTQTCPSGGSYTKLTSGTFDITYRRPNPDANFDVGGLPSLDTSHPVIMINVVSSDGSYIQSVVIRKNGQISVGN